MPKRLLIDPFVCSGCRICELVCSYSHRCTLNPRMAYIKVVRTAEGKDSIYSCRNCKRPACAAACEYDAIYLDEALVKIARDRCVGCGKCLESCPFDALRLIDGKIYKCDFCGKCVEFCPTRALVIRNGE